MTILSRKNAFLSLVALLLIAILFWTQSRFPALDEKAQMGARTHFSSLAFETLIPLSAEQSSAERIANSFVNWAMTNWQGMTFGILFGATFLTLLASIRLSSHSFRSPWLNSLYGTLMGAPMGVCANCATPVAIGMRRGGLPTGVALAGLSASPTLNVIVLTMSLSLLPLELVAVKYGLLAIYLFIVLPLLVSRFRPPATEIAEYCAANEPSTQVVNEPFMVLWLKHGLWLLKVSVPLMLLAGLLGVTAAEFVPADNLGDISYTWAGLLLVALLAMLFPVPIAFDVIVCAVLLGVGVASAYVGAAFFALGVFSIYPAMVIARDISFKLAICIGLSVFVLAIVAGVVSQMVHQQKQFDREALITHLMDENKAKPLMRNAARQCHQFPESEQQPCFELFITQTLSQQFDEKACVFLEDALAYRNTCTRAFHYLQTREKAISQQNPNICIALPEDQQARCLFDVNLEVAVVTQSLSSCMSLEDRRDQEICQQEAIALNTELYDVESLCLSLPADSRAGCAVQAISQRDMNQILAQNNLDTCQSLSDPSARQYCQGVVMVNLLEQGAEREICDGIKGQFLQTRCLGFFDYFKVLDGENRGACRQLADPQLRQQCEWDWVQKHLSKQLYSLREKSLERLSGPMVNNTRPISMSVGEHIQGISDAPILNKERIATAKEYEISHYTLNPQTDSQDFGFQQVSASLMGIEYQPEYSMIDLFEPFRYGRGIAADDINRDHWADLVFATREGVHVYRNIGGTFQLQDRLVVEGKQQPILVALADLNNDLMPDLFVSYYGGDNRIFFNEQGRFSLRSQQIISHPGANLTMAVGFHDPDLDGDIDMVWGGWSFGDLRHFRPTDSQNIFVENKGFDGKEMSLGISKLAGPAGETLSVLFSDLNHDGQAELIIANDRDTPDIIYQWREGQYSPVSLPRLDLPMISSFNTMSITSGDLNNDARLDYFSTDMTFAQGEGKSYCRQFGIQDVDQCKSYLTQDNALQSGRVEACKSLEGERLRDCLNAHLIQLATEGRDTSLCSRLRDVDDSTTKLCLNGVKALPISEPITTKGFLPGRQKNVLMMSSSEGFADVGDAFAVEDSLWAWNAQIADLDSDGWQDIFVGNGFSFGESGSDLHSNVFFHNQEGRAFERSETSFGLSDWLNSPSFVILDLDRDGDLDLISNRVAASPGVFINHTKNQSIQFSLENGLASLLGTTMTLQHRSGKIQYREISNSGGFQSYSPGTIHIGLNGYDDPIEQLEIRWPDGTQDLLKDEFLPQHHYEISRKLKYE